MTRIIAKASIRVHPVVSPRWGCISTVNHVSILNCRTCDRDVRRMRLWPLLCKMPRVQGGTGFGQGSFEWIFHILIGAL
jgi:hypothetical protein